MRSLVFLYYIIGILIFAINGKEIQLRRLKRDKDNIITVTQFNFEEVIQYVREKNGTLVLHTYKDRCAHCININKSFKELARQVLKKKDLKEKLFIGI